MLGRIAAHQAGVPVVVHSFHGFPFHSFQSPMRRAAYITLERRLGRITDRFVAVSSMVGAEAVRLGIAPAERVRVIPVSIADRSVRRDPASSREARQRLGIAVSSPLIGTVGRVDHQKAPLDFLAVLRRLGDSVHGVVDRGWTAPPRGRGALSTYGAQRPDALRRRTGRCPASAPGA